MCQRTNSKKEGISPGPQSSIPCDDYDIISDVTTTTPSTTNKASGWWRPLHPLVIVALIPFCPSWFFLNRGFTQWFHWGFVFYLLTGQRDICRRFLVIQGGAVSAGWYSAVVYEYLYYGNFCHLLYSNMPANMKEVMLTNGKKAASGIITNTAPALANLAATHLIDLLAHPILTYVIWKMHTSRGGTLRSLVSWDVLFSCYVWCRVYSLTHMYYNNNGVIDGLFYYGYDVYNIDHMESYTIAYAGEALFYVALVAYKWNLDVGNNKFGWNINIRMIGNSNKKRRRSRKNISPKQLAMLQCGEDRQKPKLIQSESSFSTASLPVEQQ